LQIGIDKTLYHLSTKQRSLLWSILLTQQTFLWWLWMSLRLLCFKQKSLFFQRTNAVFPSCQPLVMCSSLPILLWSIMWSGQDSNLLS